VGKLNPELKDVLKAGGYWDDFKRYREELKESGIDAKTARDDALDRYLPLAEGYIKSNGGEIGSAPSSAVKGVSKSRSDEISSLGPDEKAGMKNESVSPAHIEIPEEIMNKKDADAVTEIEWVAKNLELGCTPEVIATAPDSIAVNMLSSYSSSRARKNYFWDNIFKSLIPSKAQLNHRSVIDFDGEKILDMIDSIKKIGEKYGKKD